MKPAVTPAGSSAGEAGGSKAIPAGSPLDSRLERLAREGRRDPGDSGPRWPARSGRCLPEMSAARDSDAARVRGWFARRSRDVRRRSSGPERGRDRTAVRRKSGAASGPAIDGRRSGPGWRIHLQCPEVPAAGESKSASRGDRAVLAVPPQTTGTGESLGRHRIRDVRSPNAPGLDRVPRTASAADAHVQGPTAGGHVSSGCAVKKSWLDSAHMGGSTADAFDSGKRWTRCCIGNPRGLEMSPGREHG